MDELSREATAPAALLEQMLAVIRAGEDCREIREVHGRRVPIL
ncbi:MAG: hypothetical protein ACYDBY_16190 [Thermoanaerobaculia bacterium]